MAVAARRHRQLTSSNLQPLAHLNAPIALGDRYLLVAAQAKAVANRVGDHEAARGTDGGSCR
ncbi:hypothetical protein A4G29_23180 [Mycobacterium kansasii]|nr:hypothetical protein A4G29_23180 [Mycobacterium kansasii]